jgi:flagellar motor protein MotB
MEFARPGRRVGVLALAVAWVVVVATAVVAGTGGIEDELGDQAQQALTDSGLTVDDLRVDGRDVVIAAPADARPAVEAALGDVTGVRTVRFSEPTDGPVASGDSADPADSSGAGGSPPDSVSPPQRPETSTTTEAPPSGVAYLSASLRGGQVVIEGAIPDPQVAAQVAALTELVYSPLLRNDLTVDESLATASWVANTAAIVTRLPIVGTSSVRVIGEDAEIGGLAPTEARLAQFLGAMQQALGPDVSVTSDVQVTGFEAPFVRAEAPGDGTVRLTGTMPSLEVVRLIAGTAIEVFGTDAVINELEVGENVDTTFSLFRLPLAFVAFEPVPQWEVTIDDDVITGSLRGGATFPSGSARLTPELLALLPVAAGILARNPTLGMIIEGHTDSIGSDEDNLRLSVARAEAARVWLIEAGIEADRVVAVGYGETRPIGDNQTTEGRALNRRVEFVLAPASALGDQG